MKTVNHQILCFGDSNTYGYDPRAYLGGRYPESVRWTGLLKAAGWEAVNQGENGRCIPRSAREAGAVGRAAHRIEAEVTVIMLGSNDLLQQPIPSAEACTRQMEQFLTELSKEIPASCKILLIAPPPMKLGAWVNDSGTLEESCRLAGCYDVLAQRLGIHFADAGTWEIELAFDGVHFSERGHLIFAEGIQRTLEQIVSSKKD